MDFTGVLAILAILSLGSMYRDIGSGRVAEWVSIRSILFISLFLLGTIYKLWIQ